jgi:hypothetical protein
MLKKIIALAITSGLAAQALRLWINRESARQRGRAAADVAAPEVQRWEAEGGNPAPGKGPTGAV